ncbi:MAG TPA: ATP-dependent DNA ligase [Firmicutes bacterium]|nr:ATP-dependent DNA ligase [Bacillota bacterium]
MTTNKGIPDRLLPMLAVPAEPFDSSDFLFEIKWDGLRCLAFLTDRTRLQSRNQSDITLQYPELWETHRLLRTKDTILDGEIIVLAEGAPSFFQLQSRMRSKTERSIRAGMRNHPVIYVLFDLLYLEGRSLLDLPFQQRRAYLENLYTPSPHLLLSECFPEHGRSLFAQVKKAGLEGLVGKDRNSLYFPGKRSPVWRKCRVTKSDHFLICGYTTNPKGRADLSALVIAAKDREDNLVSFGLVGAGLSQAEIDHVLRLLKPRIIKECPLSHQPGPSIQKAVWVKPELVCEVEYLELTPDRHLRHPLYRGLRPEVSPEECRIS